MHWDVSAFILPCGDILKYFCSNVDVTLKNTFYVKYLFYAICIIFIGTLEI